MENLRQYRQRNNYNNHHSRSDNMPYGETVQKEKLLIEIPDIKKKVEISKEEFEKVEQITILYRGRKYQIRATANGKLLMS